MRELLIAFQLARIIAGEAPGCSIEAKAAVAWVADNRVQQGVVEHWQDGWYGDRDPGSADVVVALLWRMIPDPTSGAIYLIGPRDKIKMPWLKSMERSAKWKCNGTSLEAYRNKGLLRKSTERARSILTIQPIQGHPQSCELPGKFLDGGTSMANDTETLNAIKVVLRQFLSEEQIDPVAKEMLSAFHGPWFPQHEKKVIPGDSYIFRVKGNATARKLGGIVGDTPVLAGNDENGWTPIVIHAWMATHLLK